MKNKRNVAKQTYCLEKEFSKSKPHAKHHLHEATIKIKQQAPEFPQEIHNDCLSCGHDITHPLCPNCIAKAFLVWTKKFPEHKEIKSKLNAFMKHHNKIQAKSKSCVACASQVHICPLCFTAYLYQLVKEAGLGVRATSEFLFMFNFDFEHNGYSQELEAIGGY